MTTTRVNHEEDDALVNLMRVAGQRFNDLMHEVEQRARNFGTERGDALDPRLGTPRCAALQEVTREVILGKL